MYYDALQRVTRTVYPDNSQQWVIYGVPYSLTNVTLSGVEGCTDYAPTPWINYTYDSNDLAPITNPTGSNVPVADWYTPKSAEVDALGRTIKTTEHIDKVNLPPVNNIVMQYSYDVRGNLVLVKDPYNRNVFEHVYDLRTPQEEQPLPPLYTKHIDKGISTILFDAMAKPIQGNDAKGARSLSAYDVLQRPTHSWANDNLGEATTLRQYFTYGDLQLISPASFNLNGKIYQQYDESGLLQNLNFDFKNNLLHKQQQTISDTELLSIFGGATISCYRVDWTGLPPILGAMVFETNIEYDALNRITKLIQPLDANGTRKEIEPTYNKAGVLESIVYDGATYVEHIAYNAKGQRLLVAYGNNIMTRHAYNPYTFRQQRQRSESYTKTGWTYSPAGNVKQDTQYTFDLIGNITNTNDATTGCGVGGTNNLSRNFSYDPIYRLLSATGRENQPTITPIWDDSYRSDDNSTTTAYTQNYSYDKLGNIQQLQHIGTNSFTRNFNYLTNNNQLQNVQIGLTTYAFTYDNCGNQLTETTSRHWEWDYKNMSRCFYVEAGGNVTQYTQYLYDANGQRVKKLVWKQSGDFDSYTYIDGNYEYRINEIGREQTLHHVMDEDSRLAIIREGYAFGDTTPAIKYNLQNYIGSSTVYLNNGGSDVNFEEYYAFGETSFGSYALKRYKYCGKERDIESGLIYYGARYCSAWTCRFVSVDPLSTKYMHQSPYLHADNNPIAKIDHMGKGTDPSDGDDKNKGNAGCGNADAVKQTTSETNKSGHNNPEIKKGEKYNIVFFSEYHALKEGDAVRSAYLEAIKAQKEYPNLIITLTSANSIFGPAADAIEKIVSQGASVKNAIFDYHGLYNKPLLGGIDETKLKAAKSDLERIGKSLAVDGSIVLTSCHTGKFDSFIGFIAKATQRNVIASESYVVGGYMFNNTPNATLTDDEGHKYKDFPEAYDRAGFWKIASPDGSNVKGYSISSLPTVGIDKAGNVNYFYSWRTENYSKYVNLLLKNGQLPYSIQKSK